MSKSANKTVIGAFVAGALVLVFIAIAVFGSGQLFEKTTRYVLFFDSSIRGLSLGSSVMFRGVPVGRVADIELTGDLQSMNFQTPVYIELDNSAGKYFTGSSESISNEEYLNRLIAHGLRASLGNQSILTGQLLVELNFYPLSELPSIITETTHYGDVLEIPTIPSKLDDMMEKAFKLPYEQITANILSISEQLDKLLKSEEFRQIVVKTNTLLDNLNNLSAEVSATLQDVRSLTGPYTELAATTEKRLDTTLVQVSAFLRTANKVAEEARQSMAEARSVLNQNSPTVLELNQAIREVNASARAVRVLANTLERHPEALLRGK